MKKLIYAAIAIQCLTLSIQKSFAQASNDNIGSGNCLSFDGINDWASIPNDPIFDFGNGNFTIEFWVNITDQSLSGAPGIIARNNAGYEPYLIAARPATGNVELFASDGSSWDLNMSMGSLSIGTWHHYAVSRNGNTFTSYKDGVLAATTTNSLTIKPGTNVMEFGRNESSELEMILDEVRIWNVSRTQAEIRDNMCQQLVGSEAGLIGYWNMNEGTGNTFGDLTSNNNDGTRQ